MTTSALAVLLSAKVTAACALLPLAILTAFCVAMALAPLGCSGTTCWREPLQYSEDRLLAEIEDLRTRHPRTQDLYREVCVLLFFRHGITPTANKLYQLVRKGSMSAPTEALNHFWQTLRERARITIEHADLPEELQAAAGEMVAALWKSAQAMSREALARFQIEAAEAVDAAKVGEASAQAAHAETLEALELARVHLRAGEELAGRLREELAAAAATKAGLEGRLGDMQMRLDQTREPHAAEQDRLADRARLAEERFADMEKRALLEVDRERTALAKLQKGLESERALHAAASERMRADHNTAQAAIGQLREHVGSLQNAVHTLGNERDRERAELQSMRRQLDTAIRDAAANSARADQLRGELERHRTEARLAGERAAPRGAAKKRQRKAPENADTP
jgi:chromosome segregation ATPase